MYTAWQDKEEMLDKEETVPFLFQVRNGKDLWREAQRGTERERKDAGRASLGPACSDAQLQRQGALLEQ